MTAALPVAATHPAAPINAAIDTQAFGESLGSLPQPAAGLDGIQDAMAKLQALVAATQKQETKGAELDVTVNQAARQGMQRQREADLEEARRKAEAGGLFKWISKDIGLVGVVGLATFNYGLVAADLAAHKAGAVENLNVDVVDAAVVFSANPALLAADLLLRKIEVLPDGVKRQLDDLGLGTSLPGITDEDVKPVVDKVLVANMLIAGAASAILTAGTTTALVVASVGLALSAGGMATQWAGGPEWLALGLQVTGAVCSLGSGVIGGGAVAASGAAGAAAGSNSVVGVPMSTAKAISTGVNGASAALNGTDKIVGAANNKASDDANERATAARHVLKKLELILDGIMEALQESHESFKKTSGAIQQALQIHNQTLVLSASSLKG